MSNIKPIFYENLKELNKEFFPDFKEKFDDFLNSGWYILGETVKTFEKNFSKYNNSNFTVGLASGLDALHLAINSLNLEKGSEIIVPSNTYIATILAITNNGHIPVMVEPDIKTYNINPDLIEDKINEHTNYIFVSSGAANSKYSQNYGDYGHDKKQVERRLQDSKLNYKIVRPSYIVGEGNHRPRLGHYLNKINNREHIEVAGNGQNKVNIVFVQDVVRDLIRLVKTPQKTLELVESVGDNIEIIDLIYKVNEYSREGEVMLVQDDESAVLPKNDFIFETNSEYTKLEDGLKEYAKWFYNKGAKKYGYNI